jgi:hypothetical protein
VYFHGTTLENPSIVAAVDRVNEIVPIVIHGEFSLFLTSMIIAAAPAPEEVDPQALYVRPFPLTLC